LPEKLGNLERYGYEGIELWGRAELGDSLDSVRQAISSSRIRVSAICSGYPGDLLSPDREARRQALRGLVERLRWCSELGAVGVITVPTFGPAKLPDLSPVFRDQKELEERLLVEELKSIANVAEDTGSKILLEPLNRYETHFMNRLEQAADLCARIGSEGVKIMADYFHMSIEERDIAESLREHVSYVFHVHLADSNRLTPGSGHTDFSSLRVLRDEGYRFYLSLECGIQGDPAIELPKTLRYLRSQLT
jgi:sugar phosphate isomerase/epimerase